ncbi:cell division control protein 14, SIN component-domain-containing protein [Leucosporidium creatinivorum]|uniref:Cell division control protein 14, SIN component-domain-containing protein n=1 Tax=Leucosporidium creatinivorum TaxID=106004 RepID=A0A1Y2FA09_9BASI|nr:cell division control protein 14, SIN component-domain-containing protein [Leucosporidium creatinivorum]
MRRLDIDEASDALLSLRSTDVQHSQALATLERLLASLALQQPPEQQPLLDAFLSLQDSFQHNLTSILLEWLGRTIARQEQRSQAGVDVELLRSNLVRCLGLIQGLLLLHRRSQRLFARRAALEYVLAVLDFSRPSAMSSPLLSSAPANPSPVLFPPSPTPSASSPNPSAPNRPAINPAQSSPTALSLVALDTLLCALVDRPKNMRVFEQVGGLAGIVKVLKDKSVAQVVRIKVIELLYYYLLPEAPPRRSASTSSASASTSSIVDDPYIAPPALPQLLASAAGDFIPQTPVRPRHHRSQSSLLSTPSRHGSPTRPPRSTPSTPQLGSVLLEAEQGDEDGTPRAARSADLFGASSSTPRSAPTNEERTPRRSTSHPRARSRSGGPAPVEEQGREESRRAGRTTRTEKEKKELLRRVMPNVDALEERFRAMGLQEAWGEEG